MRLAISSEVLPEAGLEELLEACFRRGIGGLELVSGRRHPLPEVSEGFGTWRRGDSEVEIVVYRTHSAEEALSGAGAALSLRLGVPVTLARSGVDPDLLRDAAARYAELGGRLLLAAGPDLREIANLARLLESLDQGALGIALDVRPLRDDLAAIGDVLPLAGRWLRLVRLHGGGPEGATQLGRGVGGLMASLALRRYSHPLVLAPSSRTALPIWSAWLGLRGGWGCGSKAEPVSIKAGAGARP